MQAFRDGYEISDDPTRLDRDMIYAFLHDEAYWSRGIPRAVLERAIVGSLNLGIYHGDRQVGYARIVTDRATFAWVCDLFIVADHRGRGLGHWLVETTLAHAALEGLGRVLLATADAHGVYRDAGFRPLADPSRWMEITVAPEVLYGAPVRG